eukprot:TRINITY_DN4699_c0_g1_i4.p1 TRINITY_DN4699_c0_g1~~TRINITY_DN4699_c0_g1_i4.p1  ORF type:complete len:228 (+),score=37.83 TRINITY_DN4699_c0_g1_i4:53-685(+)
MGSPGEKEKKESKKEKKDKKEKRAETAAGPRGRPPWNKKPWLAEELRKLGELKSAGVLEEREFAAAKARVLGLPVEMPRKRGAESAGLAPQAKRAKGNDGTGFDILCSSVDGEGSVKSEGGDLPEVKTEIADSETQFRCSPTSPTPGIGVWNSVGSLGSVISSEDFGLGAGGGGSYPPPSRSPSPGSLRKVKTEFVDSDDKSDLTVPACE